MSNIQMDAMNCVVDPQVQLSTALSMFNIRDFRIALDMGAEPTVNDQQHTNIYEKALRTRGCADFVEECLKRGCSPYYVNTHYNKAAINFAADSYDPRIIRTLLKHPNIQVDFKYSQLTPMNSLAKHLTSEKVPEVVECIKLLLQYGASPNIPDQCEKTPLHYILKNRKIDKNQKREIVEIFLDNHNLDIDTYRDGEVRLLLQQEFPHLKIPAQKDSVAVIDMEMLISYIRSGNMDKFQQQLHQFELNRVNDQDSLRNTTQEHYQPLLIEAIKRYCHVAFDTLWRLKLDINALFEGTTALEVAAVWGNWYALQKILDHPDLQLKRNDHPLITVIRKLNEVVVQDFCNYRKCFFVLLESNKIDINEKDNSGSTPLHYAVKYRINDAITELLKRGAYIGIKSKFNDLPIEGMSADILEQHFDNCISSNGVKVGDENFEILINYMNLLPQQQSTYKKSPSKLPDEMAPIAFLAKSKEHRYLLQHPLITSFLFLKWHRLSVVFYINFFIYIFFALSLITHTVLKFRESEYEHLTFIFGICSWIGIIYLVLREFLQLIMSPLNYLRSLTNYMELLLIILAIMTCSEPSYDRETQRIIAVFTMLLIAVELCLLVGSLPVLSLSTHLLMLDAVFWSFLKSFTLYSIFVVAFSLCFYILFGKPEQIHDDAADKPEESEDFNKFTNPLAALIKTIVMLTGEFDAGDLEFNSLFSYLLFLLFVFLMTMVLFNLLNGLAVSDTQAIKGQAEINGFICRTNLLTRYEEVLTGRSEHSSFVVNHQPFRYICRRLTSLYPHCLNGPQIAILPNDNNKILVPIADSYELQDMNGSNLKTSTAFLRLPDHDNEKQKKLLDPPVKVLPCCCNCILGKCSQMDNRTVKLALAVLEQKAVTMKNQKLLQKTEKRLESVERKLDRLLEILKVKHEN